MSTEPAPRGAEPADRDPEGVEPAVPSAAPSAGTEPPGRRAVLLRLDPAVHHALQRWAADDLRSLNSHIELLLRRALDREGRSPRDAGPLPRRGRPPGATPPR